MVHANRRPAGFRIRSVLLWLAGFAAFLGWERCYGWPGALLLSLTQFPSAWWTWVILGATVGRMVARPLRSPGLYLTLVGVGLGMFGLAIVLYMIRELTWRVCFGGAIPSTAIQSWIVDADIYLLNHAAVPIFWKSNCTHPPITLVFGITLTIAMVAAGTLAGVLSRNLWPRPHGAPGDATYHL